VLVVMMVGSLVLTGVAFMFIPMPRQQEPFSLEVRDAMLNDLLDPSGFSCQVYATNDTGHWQSYVLLQNDTADHIEGPPEADCDYMVSYSGQAGNVTYPERWRWIYPNRRNVLLAFAKPAFASMTIKNASTNATVDPVGITTQDLIIEVNTDPSDPNAGYFGYYDPRIDDFVMPWIQVNFNASVGFADHGMVDGSSHNLLEFRYNSTCLGFGMPYLMCQPDPITTAFTNTMTAITSIHLLWGDEVLC